MGVCMGRRRAAEQPRKIAFVADVHLANFRDHGGQRGPDGLNERGRLCVETLARALARAKALGATCTYVCGDMFHHCRPEPAIVAAAQRVIEQHEGMVMILPGNHDLLDATPEHRHTACEVLRPVAGVYYKPALSGADPEPTTFCVPFDARKPMPEVIEEACAAFVETDPKGLEGVTLVTHVGVVDDVSPPWLKEAPDAIHVDRLFAILKKHGMSAAFVGNYHQHRMWTKKDGTVICQLGALNPTGFGDEGLLGYGGLALWDGREVQWEGVPGPRFLRLRGQELLEAVPECAVFARADRGLYAEGALAAYKAVEEVDPAEEPGVIERIDSAKPDRLLEGAEEALEEYVSKMVLPEGVGRAELLARVKDYWRRA